MKESNLERRGEKSAIRQRRQIVASECLGLNCSAEVLSSRQSLSLRNTFGDRERKIEKRPLTFTSLCPPPPTAITLLYMSSESFHPVITSLSTPRVCRKTKTEFIKRQTREKKPIITDNRKQVTFLTRLLAHIDSAFVLFSRL